MMKRIVLGGAALAFGILTSPLAAQTVPPERPPATAQPGPGEPASPTMQATPDAPSASAQSLPEPPPPPPFPPMPRARPSHRFTTGGEHHAATVHHRSTTHAHHRSTRTERERARTHHHSTRSERERARMHHGKAHQRTAAAKPSRKTIRFCHGLNYRQIMRHSACRELMNDELNAPTHRHHHAAHRHAADRHSTKHHRKVVKARSRHSRRHRS